MQTRSMDELFTIQRSIGEIAGVMSLTSEKEPTTFDISADMIEQAEEEEEQKEAPQLDENGEPIPKEEENQNAEEQKAPAFNPKRYKWTMTNGMSKNLPQLLRDVVTESWSFDDKNWKTLGCNSHADAAVKSLDEFCSKV